MSATVWHVPDGMLDEYGSGRLDPARVMSVEAHLSGCAGCRTALRTDADWLARSWEQVTVTVSRPRLTLVERVLRGCGVPAHLARMLAATPTLGRAWLAAVGGVLAFAVIFAYASHASISDPARLLPFFLVAPALPLLGIAVAYGPRVDPAYEMLAAAPVAAARLLLWRASAVLVTALVPAGLATPVLPGPPLLGAAWLLPALALTTACLALATRMPVPVAAGGLMTTWVVVVLLAGGVSGERLFMFAPAVQPAYAAAAALLTLVTYLRRRHLDPGEPRWSPRWNIPSILAR